MPAYAVRRLRALLVLVLLLAGCGTPAEPEVGLRASPDLVAATAQLAPGARTDDDAATLVAVFTEADHSIDDLATMTTKQYKAAHGRGPSDQAHLVGRWLGLASNAVRGRVVADQIRAAARAEPMSLPLRPEDKAADLLSTILLELNAKVPNETADNPKLPNPANLRVAFQSGYTEARG